MANARMLYAWRLAELPWASYPENVKRVSLTLDEVILSILKEKVRCLRVQKLADFVGKIE